MANTISRAGDGGSYKASPKQKSEPAPRKEPPAKEAPSRKQTPIRDTEVEAPRKAAPTPKAEPPARAAPANKQTPIRAAEVEAPKKAASPPPAPKVDPPKQAAPAPVPKVDPPAKVTATNKPTPIRDVEVDPPKQAAPAPAPKVDSPAKVTPTNKPTPIRDAEVDPPKKVAPALTPKVDPPAIKPEIKVTQPNNVEPADRSRERLRDDGMNYPKPVNNSAPVNGAVANPTLTKVANENSATVTQVQQPHKIEEVQSTKPVTKATYVSSKITRDDDPISKDVKVVNNNNSKVLNYNSSTAPTGKNYEKAKYSQYDEMTLNEFRNYNQKAQTKAIVNGSHKITNLKPVGMTTRYNEIQMMNTEGMVYSDRISGKKTGTGNQALSVIKLGDSGTDVFKLQQTLQTLGILKPGFMKGQFDQSTLNAVNQYKNQNNPLSNQGNSKGVVTEKTFAQMEQEIKAQEVNANIRKYDGLVASNSETVPSKKKDLGTKILDGAQVGLDIAGLIPVIGEIADATNAGIYFIRGDYVNAALSGMACVPFIGSAATAGKYANKGVKALGMADEAYDLSKVFAKGGVETLAKYGDDFGKMGAYAKNPGVKVDWSQFAEHGFERMAKRGVTKDMIESIVQNGKVLSQNGGSKFAYITQEGVAVVSKEGKLVTAWGKDNFDPNMIEIVTQLFGK